MSTIKIAIADDHPIIGKGIASELKGIPAMEITFIAQSSAELLKNLKLHATDILILDVVMPGVSAIDLFVETNKLYPSLKMIAYTSLNNSILIKSLFKQAGVKGYVNKNDSLEELTTAIKTVSEGKTYISNDYKHLLQSKNDPELQKISEREKEVLMLIAEQYTSAQIAEKLFISVNTVESHRKKLFEKFQVDNLAGLIKEAMKQGYIH